MIPKKDQSAPSQSWPYTEETDESFKVYTKDELEALKKANKRAFFTLSPWVVIGVQIFVTLLMGLGWAYFGNPKGLSIYTYSAFVGGFIGFFPASLLALRMSVSRRQKNRSPGSLLAAVVSGEFLKIAVTIALFVWVALRYPDLQWIPLLVTYLVTLKCYWLAWFWR